MASTQARVDMLTGRMAAAGDIAARKMFGEYGLYCDGIFFGSICKDRLFIKPTPEAADMAEGLSLEPPYPGARDCLVVPDARSEDAAWLAELVRATARALAQAKSGGAKKAAGVKKRGMVKSALT